MKKRRRILGILLALSMVSGTFSSASVFAAGNDNSVQTAEVTAVQELNQISEAAQIIATASETARNLALNQPTVASSIANNCGPELAVNGVTNQPEQWNSENMKNGTVSDDTDQNEQ